MTAGVEHQQPLEVTAAGMPGPGARLREARERRGLSREEVAKSLRLDAELIRAIEEDDYAHQPAPAFVVGYLRNYARLLGLPAEPLVSVYNALGISQPPIKSELLHRYRFGTPDRSVAWIAAGVLVVVIIAVTLWPQRGEHRLEPVEAETVVGESADSVPAANLQAPVIAPPAVLEQPALDVPPVEPLGSDVVEFRVEQESWVEVSDATGTQLYYRLVPANSEATVRGQAPFRVVLGYAPGVKVLFDGKPFDHSRFRRGNVAQFVVGNSAP